MVALLDVNVLVALFDAAHVHHEAAHAWFGKNCRDGWGTCPVTENALVRILSNPAYPGRRTTLADAVSRLRQFCSHDDHSFWPDAVSIRTPDSFRTNHIQGHRQVTDVYLLALAVANDGRLATFDRSIPIKSLEGAARKHILVIDS